MSDLVFFALLVQHLQGDAHSGYTCSAQVPLRMLTAVTSRCRECVPHGQARMYVRRFSLSLSVTPLNLHFALAALTHVCGWHWVA